MATLPLLAGAASLKEAARGSGLLLGCSLNLSGRPKPEDFGDQLAREFALVTPESALKWSSVEPAPGVFEFGEADRAFRFAEAAGVQVRGHNLAWNDNALPAWLEPALTATPGRARDLLERHIAAVVTRYRGRVQSWDVVNEAIVRGDGRPDGLSRRPWIDALGPEYIDIAFAQVASLDPRTPRVLNEVGMEADTPEGTANRAALLGLLRALRKRGVTVTHVGLESHLHVETPVGGESFRSFVAEVRSLGVEVYVTELDVDDTHTQGAPAARETAVADAYKRYLDVVLAEGEPRVVVLWSVRNGSNWLDWLGTQHPGSRRQDNDMHRPGLWEDDGRATAAYAAVERALAAHAARGG